MTAQTIYGKTDDSKTNTNWEGFCGPPRTEYGSFTYNTATSGYFNAGKGVYGSIITGECGHSDINSWPTDEWLYPPKPYSSKISPIPDSVYHPPTPELVVKARTDYYSLTYIKGNSPYSTGISNQGSTYKERKVKIEYDTSKTTYKVSDGFLLYDNLDKVDIIKVGTEMISGVCYVRNYREVIISLDRKIVTII